MSLRSILGFATLTGLLLLTARLLSESQLWSAGANWTLPWLCSALAVGLLIVGITALLCDRPPPTIPRKAAVVVYLTTVVVAGSGIVFDGWEQMGTDLFWLSIAEWLGFDLILFVLFYVPRFATRESVRAQPDSPKP